MIYGKRYVYVSLSLFIMRQQILFVMELSYLGIKQQEVTVYKKQWSTAHNQNKVTDVLDSDMVDTIIDGEVPVCSNTASIRYGR